ncbi:MAG: hypothetical protein J5I98_00895, partial [Phaeodactylibacter sp.]|nr:hypothetical protein [Phaeodactylibacter sp.]
MPTLTKAAFLAILWLAPALLWSTTAYHWDEPGYCQWQEQETQQRELENWQWRLLAGDTLRPPFSTHSCDLICPDFQVNRIVVDANCGQRDGSATIEPVGYPAGTVFSYAWSGNVSTTNEADSLAAGIYFVTVSVVLSGNGSYPNCDTKTIVPVSDVGGPDVGVNTVAANCMSEAGRVRLDILSGTPPFSISWTGGTRTAGALGTVQFVNLAAGTYTFVVADANGCKTAVVAEVPRDNSGMFDISLYSTPASGCGASDGTLTVSINGGFPPYEILFNNLNTITTSDNPYTFSNLPAGVYRVAVKDAFGCEGEGNIAITDGSPPCNNCWTAVDADCSDAIGYLVFDGCGAAHETFEVRQMNSTYIFQAVAGNGTAVIEVPAGTYRIKRISSQDACICEFNLTVETPEELTAEVEVVDDCAPDGTSTGFITVVEITGGTPPYTELIIDSLGNPVANPNNLPPGIYTITITDANNCLPLVKEIEIEGCPCGPIAVTASPVDTIICERESVMLQAVVTSSDPPGGITWFDENDTEIGTGATLAVTPDAGVHQYVVVAQSSCSADTDTATAVVTVLTDTTKIEILPADTVTLCALEEVCFEVTNTMLADRIQWVDAGGAVVGTGGELCITPPGSGIYMYIAQVDSTLRCVIPDTAYVKLVPDSLSATVEGPDKVCEGDSICLTATVGPDPAMAMVTWTDETGAVLGTGLELCVVPGPGMHTYTATADNGCVVASGSKTVKVLSDTTKIEITPADTATLCALEEIC